MNPHQLRPWPSNTAPSERFLDEQKRLHVLESYGFADLQDDLELEQIATLAARLCDAPVALVNLIELEDQCLLAHHGAGDGPSVARKDNLCAYAMYQRGLVEIRDTTTHPDVSQFAVVTAAPNVRFYAGEPIISSEGAPLGALCVSDVVPRPEGLNALQKEALGVLGNAVKRRLEAHRQSLLVDRELAEQNARLKFVLDSVPNIAWSYSPDRDFDYFNARWEEVTGLAWPRDVEQWREAIHPEDFEASLAKFSDAVRQAVPFEDEWRLRSADGNYRWVLSRAVPSSDDPAKARWFGTLTDIDETRRVSQQKELLAGELAHRIKNIFSVITGLITLHSRGNDLLAPFAKGLIEQVRALSRAQEFALQISGEREDNLKDLLGVLMAPYGAPGSSAVAINGDDVPTGKRAATPLALTLHELATNSAKYGALSQAGGRVAINVRRDENEATMAWEEIGGPEAKEPQVEGFGSRLVAMSIGHQLGGAIEYDWRAEGLRVAIRLPLDRLAQ